MKKASFKHEDSYGKGTPVAVYGTVTLKDDGKISISLYNPSHYSFAIRFRAKKLAKEIVEADFKHPAVTAFVGFESSGLVKILTEQTQELLQRFIEATKKYAQEKFQWATKVSEWKYEDWAREYGEVDLKYPQQILKHGKLIPITKELNRYAKQDISESKYICSTGLEKFEADEVANAKQHYKNSIENLAYRLNRKGIKDDTVMTIKTATIGRNITTTIEHEGTITKAWTIIASGPIQRPHYRYLIK